MNKLVLIRHGESVWNKENLFTGWTDVDLTAKGEHDASAAGKLLNKNGFIFDIAFTSVLQRAIKTLHNVLEAMEQLWIPEHKSWLLNERHYGALQGLNKTNTAVRYGEKQVAIWRRSYDIQPPLLADGDSRLPEHDSKYRSIPPACLPRAESLEDTVRRVMPLWENTILPEIAHGKRVIIAAHGNSLRALVKHLDNVSDDKIAELNIPTAIPLVYEFNNCMHPQKHYYLGDKSAIAAETEAVKNQSATHQ